MNVKEFLRKLPKAELHVHLEGTLEPDLVFELAKKNKILLPFENIAELEEKYNFENLQSFLDLYYTCSAVVVDESDFYQLTARYLQKAHDDGIRHIELFFDPQSHLQRNIPFGVFIAGIWRAIEEARQRWGLTCYLIMCFLKHLTEEDGFETLEKALPYKDKIIGVGLDSTELGNPPQKFARLFDECRRLGFLPVSHAGEEGPAKNIKDHLDVLKIKRVDHGVNCIQDMCLIDELVKNNIPLTICPLSNVRLKVFSKLEDHNLKKLYDLGLKVTVNSDDPAYFGGYLLDNYIGVYEKLNLTLDDMVQIAKNSFEASFLPPNNIQTLTALIDKFYQEFKRMNSLS